MDTQQLTSLGWGLTSKTWVKTFLFSDFKDALAFINKVGVFSEKVQHHPEIHNNYNRVTLSLWTHDEDSITEKDINWILAFEKQESN